MKKHIIWQNMDLVPEDWQGYIDALNSERKAEDEKPLTEDEAYAEIEELNAYYLDDERINLGGLEKKFDGKIIAIANLGLWNGRHNGYRLFDKVSDILYSDCDLCEWYIEGNRVKFTGVHHDGRNYYEYRILRNDRSEEAQQRFLDKILDDTVTPSVLAYYTKPLAPYIKEVYGWK